MSRPPCTCEKGVVLWVTFHVTGEGSLSDLRGQISSQTKYAWFKQLFYISVCLFRELWINLIRSSFLAFPRDWLLWAFVHHAVQLSKSSESLSHRHKMQLWHSLLSRPWQGMFCQNPRTCFCFWGEGVGAGQGLGMWLSWISPRPSPTYICILERIILEAAKAWDSVPSKLGYTIHLLTWF